MEERPLFGAGSTASKHTRNRTAFLRPAPTADGRLHPVNERQDTVRIPTAVIGTKAMRQGHSDTPPPVPAAVPTQTVATTAPVHAVPTVAPVQDVPAPANALPQQSTAPGQMALPLENNPNPLAPTAELQVQAAPVQAAPVQAVPVQAAPVQAAPVQAAPVQAAPVQAAPVQAAPVQAAPVQAVPAQAVPVQAPAVPAPELQANQVPMHTPAPAPAQPAPSPVAAAPVAPVAPVQVYQPEQQTGSEEDRQETRKRALKGGLIVLPGQMMSSYVCKIRNESSGGVMLALAEALMVPGEFYLIREADPSHKIPCRIAWREHDRLGVEFIVALSAP